MHHILHKLYIGQSLCQDESQILFEHIIKGILTPIELCAAIISMKIRGEHVTEITGAVKALLNDAKSFARPDYLFADIVGTGGDNCHSVNISTASSFVAAAAGFPIAKHGNRSVSSQTGSSDVLSACGINLMMSAEQSRLALDELGICFLFAPHYHRGFQYAIEIRQQLKTRTIFNLLGPLINPAHPPIALIGVYSPHLVPIFAETLKALGYQRAAVVYGSGLDEVAIHNTTLIAELNHGKISTYHLSPSDFGCPTYPLSALKGGLPQYNHRLLIELLQGKGQPAHEIAVAVNVSLLMSLFGEQNLKHNTEVALETIRHGKAYTLIQQLAAKG